MLFIFTALARAAEPLTEGFNFAEQIRVEKDLARSSFNMGTDFVNLTGDGGSIMGLGFKAGFEYGFSEKISLGTNLMFTFQASGKPGAFFIQESTASFATLTEELISPRALSLKKETV